MVQLVIILGALTVFNIGFHTLIKSDSEESEMPTVDVQVEEVEAAEPDEPDAILE